MHSATSTYSHSVSNATIPPKTPSTSIIKFSKKNEQKILKAFLFGRLQNLFCELFRNKIQDNPSHCLMEHYVMDSKIIQLLIEGIIESGEYTLEGIAYYTYIPIDVIYDAACGISNQLSITSWARLVDLYMQVKLDIRDILIDKLIEIIKQNRSVFSLILRDT